MEVGDVVVRDDVPGTVDLDGDVRRHHRGKLLAGDAVERLPEGTVPADDVVGIVTADEPVVRDVEVARAGVVREDPGPDVLEAAMLHRQPLRADGELGAGPDRN